MKTKEFVKRLESLEQEVKELKVSIERPKKIFYVRTAADLMAVPQYRLAGYEIR